MKENVVTLKHNVHFSKSMYTSKISTQNMSTVKHAYKVCLSIINRLFLLLKNEEGKDDSDPGGGGHTEKASLKASDSMDSLYSGQSSSSKYKES